MLLSLTREGALRKNGGSVMTLTGDAVLGEYMTVAFKNGETPVGDYFDVWACPNKDVKAIDGGEIGECAKMTFWHRGSVAGFVNETTALTMSWKLENESVRGISTQMVTPSSWTHRSLTWKAHRPVGVLSKVGSLLSTTTLGEDTPTGHPRLVQPAVLKKHSPPPVPG
jgi:hypothetical protein